jgi:hypothetical protein
MKTKAKIRAGVGLVLQLAAGTALAQNYSVTPQSTTFTGGTVAGNTAFSTGITLGSPTGGNKGTGTINLSSYEYQNGNATVADVPSFTSLFLGGYPLPALSSSATGSSPECTAGEPGTVNLGVGQQALKSLTNGCNDIAIGYQAASSIIGSANILAIGTQALAALTGTGSGKDSNVAVGHTSMPALLAGNFNVALGNATMQSATAGTANTVAGTHAMQNAIDAGTGNVAVGENAFFNLTGASFGVAVGELACLAQTSGSGNVCIGANAASSNVSAVGVVAAGFNALENNTAPTQSTAVGYYAGAGSATYSATNLTIFGYQAGVALQTGGNFNSLFGTFAGSTITTGTRNVALGPQVGSVTLATGSNNVLIGNTTGCDTPASGTNNFIGLCAGAAPVITVAGAGTITTATTTLHGSTMIMPDIANATTAATGTLCWTVGGITYDNTNTCLVSSARFKHAVEPLIGALAKIDAMRPVSFLYNGDVTNDPHLGLLAEDVARIDPRLVANDNAGRPLKVKYIDAIAMLISGMQEQQREIGELKKQIAAVKSSDTPKP